MSSKRNGKKTTKRKKVLVLSVSLWCSGVCHWIRDSIFSFKVRGFYFIQYRAASLQQLHSLYYESELLSFWTLTDTLNQHAKSRFTQAKTFRGVWQDDLMTLILSAKYISLTRNTVILILPVIDIKRTLCRRACRHGADFQEFIVVFVINCSSHIVLGFFALMYLGWCFIYLKWPACSLRLPAVSCVEMSETGFLVAPLALAF